MKTIKLGSFDGELTTDNTVITADTITVLTNDTEISLIFDNYIDFIPRVGIETALPESYVVTVVREFDNKYFYPKAMFNERDNVYRLNFKDTDFLKRDNKYSVLIMNGDIIVYQGKMIYTDKDIQNYRYTTINNKKMYL